MQESQNKGKRSKGVTDAGICITRSFIKGVRGVESRIYLPGINVGFKEELYIYPASYTAFSDTGIMRACR